MITEYDDVIDSRDVLKRIEELQEDPERDDSAEEELADLLHLQDQCQDFDDWQYGLPLIRDTYFPEYAEQLAYDIGYLDEESSWPHNHIDWDSAASELQDDYTLVDFKGNDYWIG